MKSISVSARPKAARSRRALARLFVSASLALAAGQVAAQATPDPVLVQARQSLEARDPRAAYALLDPLEAQRAGDPSFDYLLGIAALDSGHVTRAIFALERVLAVQPSNNLARAEIARAYIAAGETDTARAELTAARRGPMPAEAAAAIDRVLGALDAGGAALPEGGGIQGHLEASFGFDTNVNSATSTAQFAVPAFGGALFTLAPGSTAQDAAFVAVGGAIGLRRPLGDGLSLVASAAARSTVNNGAADFNLATLDASVGVSQARGADSFSAAVQTSHGWVGASSFRHAAGLSGQWQHNLSDTAQVAGFAQWSRLSYPGQHIRDADRFVLGAGGARTLGAADRLLFGSAYLAREEPRAAGVPHLGHTAAGLRAGLEWRDAARVWFGQAQAERRRYGGTEPFFSTGRSDHQYDLTLGVHFAAAPHWRITPRIAHTRNDSSIVIYNYTRTVVQVTARREF